MSHELRPPGAMAKLLAFLIKTFLIFFARAWTGVRGVWRVPAAGESVPRVYFANHGSHGDLVLIWACLAPHERLKTRPVAGQDYWLSTKFRSFVANRVFRVLLINRSPQPGEPSPVDAMEQVLKQGESIIIFPEGTRNTTDAVLLPFKSGIYHLHQQHPQAELIPVWIDNIRRVMPKGELLPVPMICTVTFGPPLTHIDGEDKAAFLQRAQEAVLAMRPEESRGA